MACIASDKDVIIVFREGVADPLTDFIASIPIDVGKLHLVRLKDSFRLFKHLCKRDVFTVDALPRS